MSIRRIVKWPDLRLRQKSMPVGGIDDDVRRLFADLCETMFAYDGAGLAAIQVGDPRTMFVIDSVVAGGAPTAAPVVFIDPEILWLSPETSVEREGCLSFPGIQVPIRRAQKVRVKVTNLEGVRSEITAEGYYARAIQHEFDHLTGKLLIDFASPLQKQRIKSRFQHA